MKMIMNEHIAMAEAGERALALAFRKVKNEMKPKTTTNTQKTEIGYAKAPLLT